MPMPRLGPVLAGLLVLMGCHASPPEPRPSPEALVAKRTSPAIVVPIALDLPLERLLEGHNEARRSRDMAPLRHSRMLAAAAAEQARHMANTGRISHRGTGGSDVLERAQSHGYNVRAVGENVASGQGTPEVVLVDWLSSPGHRRNILGDFDDLGLAQAKDESGRVYWCAVFGRAAQVPKSPPAVTAIRAIDTTEKVSRTPTVSRSNPPSRSR